MKKSRKFAYIIEAVVFVLIGLGILTFTIMRLVMAAIGDGQKEMDYIAYIDQSCKYYYSDIISGQTFERDGYDRAEPLFPEQGEDEEKRRQFALTKTIGDALDYTGYDEYSTYLNHCVVDTDGTIMWKDSPTLSEHKLLSVKLTTSTKLSELYDARQEEESSL